VRALIQGFSPQHADSDITVWHRKDIVSRFGRTLKDERDVHSRLMRAYPEVPHTWYGAVGLLSLITGIIAIKIFPTELPVWGFLFAVVLSALWSLPNGMLLAMTNQQMPFSRMAQLFAGYLFPSKPVACMVFKAAGFMVATQAVLFAGDLKLGHYMKIPPRIMFLAQVIAAFLSCFIVTFVQNWMFENIVDFCDPNQKNGFVCRSTKTFATNSLIWGGIGPARLFAPGKLSVLFHI
jgi:OPT family oligopeptide transporter